LNEAKETRIVDLNNTIEEQLKRYEAFREMYGPKPSVSKKTQTLVRCINVGV
jgi:hypothetical protein